MKSSRNKSYHVFSTIAETNTTCFISKSQYHKVQTMICLLWKDHVSICFIPWDTEREGIIVSKLKLSSSTPFEIRPEEGFTKRQFLSQHTNLKINNTSRLLTYRWIWNRSCCFACKLHRFNRCSKALTQFNVCHFTCPFLG